ncbi:MAG: potassium-transporting ATPase subunit KdpA [Gammaproteobacteria bacterium]|nr:potassium-transporting ATPase subunit KdpA [Gammaproteobacteria bacterium]MBU1725629.1 potassium-transporting ATPase subunit KdpA [Gammaproteobacteria bacterium]MBU2004019.1 potassium-transporting ATPase subunit KdpA [Gammaproteobacteria bacterium]
MTTNAYLQLGLYFAVLFALSWPLGVYMARVYQGNIPLFMRWLRPLESGLCKLSGVSEDDRMSWKRYALALLLFNLLGLLVVYTLQRLQGILPLNPDGLVGVAPDSAFNTAISFASNTNWQGYGGETTMSYLTQMLGLTVQNFLSAATGMAVLIALVRGFVSKEAGDLGNFWVDMLRSVLYILLPLSLVLAIVLVSQGVVQSVSAHHTVALVEQADVQQSIAVGPAASQIAIKQLGTNGGGFFNVNSAHPLENPTPLTNFLEMLAILLIPSALCVTFGVLVGDRRQGVVILSSMTILLVVLLAGCVWAEQSGNPLFERLGLDTQASELQAGGNMEGKETRFGIVNSALWATATTAASNGSVNSMHDSYTPLGGLVPMWLMQLGEVVFGGVGSGLYGMLVFALVAVFVAGLMIGRTPEYLGKKIEAFEMKMAAVAILTPPLMVLLGTALAVTLEAGRAGIANPGAHGFSEVLYAFSSAGNNNGSAFAGLSANTPFYNTLLGFAMLFARYWVIIPVLAIAGSLAAKKTIQPGAGTLPTHTLLFVLLLAGTVIVVGALTFLPALALGPVVEHLQM